MTRVIGLNSGSSFDGIDVVLAHATVNQLANNIPAASGANRFGILGKLVQPPRLAKLV